MNGTVFDIKEFSVYDGPGVRVTVFLKGCPLRCKWCHNPEGLTKKPQIMVSAACVSCGLCTVEGCSLTGGMENLRARKNECTACEKCVDKCPYAYRKIAGKEYTPKELADAVMKNEIFIRDNGGVTFSGGEPTMQAEFMLEVFELLPLHKAIETCGYCNEQVFKRVLDKIDFLFFDIKHTDPVMHKELTGVDNTVILRNLEAVKASGKPFIVRIPMIKGINDGIENLEKTASLLENAAALERVEILPYNGAAGAKYEMTGLHYEQPFIAPEKGEINLTPFEKRGIKCKIM